MSFWNLFFEILRLIATFAGLAVQLHAEQRQTKTAEEVNAAKKDDRQPSPMVLTIVIIVKEGK
jgi:hypothetical protein